MIDKAETEYRRAWTQQLLKEHDNINWQYSASLKKPLIEITDSLSVAGYWHPAIHTIKIASWLIKDYDWQVVQLVFRHELAHQYVTEIFHADDEVAHGLSFQRACDRLGLMKPEFRSATGHIPRFIKDANTPKNGLPGKIEKLFALAESANENEASLALQKANELMRRHNIQRLSNIVDSNYDCVIINHKKKRIDTHQRLLCNILKDYYFVNVITSRVYDQHTLDTYRTIELTGEKVNLDIAEHVYFFIEKKLHSLWMEHRKNTGALGKEKRSFFLGVLNGFKQKLERDEKKVIKNSGGKVSALIHTGDPGLEKYYHTRYPRLRQVKHSGPRVFRDTFKAGKKEGSRLTIHKGVSQSDGNKGKLIVA